MLLNSYEVFDQLIVGAVVGGLIMIIAYIMKFFKKNKKGFSKENEPQQEIKKNKKSKMSNLANDLINLGELNKLKEEGILTEEEFLEQKRNIL